MENNFFVPSGYTVKKTEELTDIEYVGYSLIEETTSSEKWVVLRITTDGNIQTFEYAEGSWDNRASLTYK